MKTHFLRILLIVLCGLSGTAQAALYRGTVGAAEVVADLPATMSLRVNPALTYWLPQYFYVSHRQPIELVPAACDVTLCYDEYPDAGNTEKVSGHWRLQREGEGWRGEWRSPDGARRLAIALEAYAFTPSDPLAGDFARHEPFSAVLLDNVTWLDRGTETFMGKTLRRYAERESGLEHVLVEAGYADDARQALNRMLRGEALAAVAARRECFAWERRNPAYENYVTVEWLDDALASFSTRGFGDCGGAHPNTWVTGLAWYVPENRKLALEDVLWVGDGPPQRFAATFDFDADDQEALWAYQRTALAPWLHATFRRLYPEPMQAQPDADMCDYSQVEDFADTFWWLDGKGVHIGINYPFVRAACREPGFTVLPFDVVRQHPGAIRALKLPDGR